MTAKLTGLLQIGALATSAVLVYLDTDRPLIAVAVLFIGWAIMPQSR